MVKNMMPVYILSAIACCCFRSTAASVCKPHSVFKVDCNTCRCSSSGMEFSCTDVICEPLIYKDKYLIEQNEKGYSILKPKPGGNADNDKKLNHNNDLFIDNSASNKANHQRAQRYLVKPRAFDRIMSAIKSNRTVKDSPDSEEYGIDYADSDTEIQVDDENSFDDVEDYYLDENSYNDIDNEDDYEYTDYD